MTHYRWRYSIALRVPEGVDIPSAAVDGLAALLGPLEGTAATSGSQLRASITVVAGAGGAASDEGERVVLGALDAAGVPDWPVVRAEVVREDEIGR